MAYKKITTRHIQKHDIESNWEKAKRFIPMKSEIVVYDIDENHAAPRFKIGDGVTVVGDLPFIVEQPDWSQTDETAPDYIKNKPTSGALPAVSADDDGKILRVVNGQWEAVAEATYGGEVVAE